MGELQIFENWRRTLVFSIWEGLSNRGKGLYWIFMYEKSHSTYSQIISTVQGCAAFKDA